MPLMPRLPGKGKKIAYAILGKPANMRKRKKTKEDKRLMFEESY